MKGFAYNRWGLFSFQDRDHGPRDGSKLRPWIDQQLLAANIDQDQLVSLHEVKQMLEGHFGRLDTNKDGMINLDEYADQHIKLFLTIDADSNQKLSPAEVRLYNMKGVSMKRNIATKNQLYKTTYKKIEDY